MRPPSWKGKEKAASPPGEHRRSIDRFAVRLTGCRTDDRMWVDIYEPGTEADLAVHVRKVEDVRRWLQEAFEGGPSGKLKKYRVRV